MANTNMSTQSSPQQNLNIYDVNGLTRELVSLLESLGGQLPLDKIELEGRNKTVHVKICLTRLEVEDGLIKQRLVVFRDELKELLESFFYDIPFTLFERRYQQTFNRSLDYQSLGVSNLEELIVKMDGVAMLIEDRQRKEKHVISFPVIENRRKLLKLRVKELLNKFDGITSFSCFEWSYKREFEEELDYYYYGLTDLEDLCEFLKDILVVGVAFRVKVIRAVDFEEHISEASMWVKPGDVRGLKRNIVTLLNNHGGKIKLGDVASQYHALFGRPLVSREFNCRTIENLIRDLVEDAEIQGGGSNKIVHLKHTLRRVDVVTDDLRRFIESFSLGIPLSIFEALYGNEKSVTPLNQYFMSYGVKDVEGLCQANPDVAMLIKDKKASTKRVMYTPVVKDRQKRLERDVIRLLEAYAGRTLFHCFEEYYKEMFRESIMYTYYGLTDLEHLCEVLKDTLEVTVEEVPVKSGGVCKLKQIHLLEYCQRYYSGGKE